MHDVNGFCVDIYTVIFPQELQELFSAFDKDGSGVIDFDEFLLALRVSLHSIGTIPRLYSLYLRKRISQRNFLEIKKWVKNY